MEKTRVIVSDIFVMDATTKEETRILGEMVFGRAEVDRNYPKDTQISRRHFRLVPADDVVLIEDLGSTNRTKVNGKLLKANTLYKLRSRDFIEFGQQKVQIFIGGKIVGDATKLVSRDPTNDRAVDQSMVFERLVTGEEAPRPAGSALERASQQPSGEGIIRGIDGLDLQSESDQKIASKKDDAIIQSLVQKKNTAWYLQFGGSEFGPLSLKELRVVVKSNQFQGGELYAFTEGLADWLPITKLQKFLDEPVVEFTATQRIGTGFAVSGKVVCTIRGEKKGIPGTISAISLAEITIATRDPLPVSGNLFEIDAEPDPATGIEPFKATVKLDTSRSLRNSQVLLFIQATPRTKMGIERFIRAQG
jgi:pSer/pThr/pTyr-binding forkhead associated (FHA) protein